MILNVNTTWFPWLPQKVSFPVKFKPKSRQYLVVTTHMVTTESPQEGGNHRGGNHASFPCGGGNHYGFHKR